MATTITPVSSSSSGLAYKAVALTTILLPIAGLIAAALYIHRFDLSGLDLALLAGMYTWTILFGVEFGYHRLLTHKTLKTRRWLRNLAVMSGCMAAEGQPIWWTAIHRRHHQFGDEQGDPHSPNVHGEDFAGRVKGAFHSHIGWMFDPRLTDARAREFVVDLLRDKDILLIDRLYWVWVVTGMAIPALIGGIATQSMQGALGGFLMGGIVRLFFGQHALWWGIVTACHRWGYRSFESGDRSVNNWFVAIIFFGDGWHNNHHAFPYSAKVGLRWWEIDMTWWLIRLLAAAGLAWDVQTPGPVQLEAKRLAFERAPS